MKNFSDLFDDNYANQSEDWEKTLKSELKLDEISSKTFKKQIDISSWPTLSLAAQETHHFSSLTPWKKASQTYFKMNQSQIAEFLLDDLESGVRVFFFHKDFITDEILGIIKKTFESFPLSGEVELYFLGKKILNHKINVKCIDEIDFIHAREVHEFGGHTVHELAMIVVKMIQSLNLSPTHAAVFVDSHFFKNMAKIRALKLLMDKVLKEVESQEKIKIITLNSFREWTLFERYSNMLRNNTQVASAYIGGADVIQSSGYQLIFDLETNATDVVHEDRSRRMARNTTHILGLESMLGIVEDAAYGSFHLENLSNKYAEESWKLMQTLLKLDPLKRDEFLQADMKKVAEQRMERVKTRKDVLAGMNDFPDGRERLGVQLLPSSLFRVSRPFEDLRLKIEELKDKPQVQILMKGDPALLNNRINFIKNYFELLGLDVIDHTKEDGQSEKRILVLCAKDEDYPDLVKVANSEKATARFIAGKFEGTDFEPIYSGQNIYDVLERLVSHLGGDQ